MSFKFQKSGHFIRIIMYVHLQPIHQTERCFRCMSVVCQTYTCRWPWCGVGYNFKSVVYWCLLFRGNFVLKSTVGSTDFVHCPESRSGRRLFKYYMVISIRNTASVCCREVVRFSEGPLSEVSTVCHKVTIVMPWRCVVIVFTVSLQVKQCVLMLDLCIVCTVCVTACSSLSSNRE